jgi:hypothetical protein
MKKARKTRSDKGINRKVTFEEVLTELNERGLISKKAYKKLRRK